MRSGRAQGGKAFKRHALNAVSQPEQVASTDTEFLRQMQRGDALTESAQDHDQSRGREAHALERRAGEHVEDLAAGATAVVHHGLTVAIMGGLIIGQLVSLGAPEALRVDRLKQQPVARALVQQVVDREQHGA